MQTPTRAFDGVSNFAKNIKPTMLKLKDNKPLTKKESKQVVEFYLEVLSTISTYNSICTAIENLE